MATSWLFVLRVGFFACGLFVILIGLHCLSNYSSYINNYCIDSNDLFSIDRQNLLKYEDVTYWGSLGQRGSYWVAYNYFKASRHFCCNQTITYTTHADWTYLDNLIPLLERWQGPLSIAVYSPGTDFDAAIKKIEFLRECGSTTDIKELVSFHIFFDQGHAPRLNISQPTEYSIPDCSSHSEIIKINLSEESYKSRNGLKYPVNMARNIAREMATTFYVLSSDIELYPSPNMIPEFLSMMQRNSYEIQGFQPKVFVLPVFEVDSTVSVLPVNKGDLVHMLQNKSAIPFHKNTCQHCHRIPNEKNWHKTPVENVITIFYTAKRHKPYQAWEPFYIGTKYEPMFDERLTWEGQKDKMIQAYVLCLLDYEFLILDNAFLVHKPGIKRRSSRRNKVIVNQSKLIANTILPDLQRIYGSRAGCVV